MATISLNASAPKVDSEISFSLANEDFALASDGSFESTDPAVIGSAVVHPWLKVEFKAEAEQATSDYDPNDPHQNPAADHLSAYASPETKAAAEATEAAIQAAAYPEQAAAAEVEETDEAELKADTTPAASDTSQATSPAEAPASPQEPAPQQAADTSSPVPADTATSTGSTK